MNWNPSLFEHQVHQNIISTNNRRYSIHVNKKSDIGLKAGLQATDIFGGRNNCKNGCNFLLSLTTKCDFENFGEQVPGCPQSTPWLPTCFKTLFQAHCYSLVS